MLKQYVSPFYLMQVEQQMAEAMLYKATKTTLNDALQVWYLLLVFVEVSANDTIFTNFVVGA